MKIFNSPTILIGFLFVLLTYHGFGQGAPPITNMSGTICAGVAAQFRVTTSCTINQWIVSPGGVIQGSSTSAVVYVKWSSAQANAWVEVMYTNCSTPSSLALVVNAAATPTVSIVMPTDICQPQSITLQANTTDVYGTPNYSWTIDGQSIGVTTSNTISYSASSLSPGTNNHNAVVTLSNLGCYAGSPVTSPTKQFSVKGNVGQVSTPSGPPTRCAGSGTGTYSASATDATSYEWSIAQLTGPTSPGTISAGNVTWNSSFAGTARITVVAKGCNSSSTTAFTDVTVSSTPVVSLSGIPTRCQGSGNDTFYGSTSYPAGTVSYTILPGQAGSITTGAAGYVTWNAGFIGEATITYTAQGCNGTSASATQTVQVRPASSTVTTPLGELTRCVGDGQTTFTASAVNVDGYSWSISAGAGTIGNGGVYGGLSHGNVTWNSSFTGTATITVTTLGCSPTSRSVSVTTNALPSVSLSPIGVQATTPVTLSTPLVSTYNYQWYLNGSPISGMNANTLKVKDPGNYSVEVSLGTCKAISPIPATIPANQYGGFEIYADPNYIKERVARVDRKQDGQPLSEADMATVTIGERHEMTNYFDGLGRGMQKVIMQGSSSRTDVVQPTVYDNYGRTSTDYLPFTTGGDGSFKSSFRNKDQDDYATGPQYLFYQTGGPLAADPQPYGQTKFEASQLNRPLSVYGPGHDWSPGVNDKALTRKYLLNTHSPTGSASATDEKVIAFKIDNITGLPGRKSSEPTFVEETGHFSTNQLFVNVTTDEDGNIIREYVNKIGQIILKKAQTVVGSTNLNNTAEWAMTYYIFDELGLLRYVFQPELSKKLHDDVDSYVVSSDDLKNFAFQYKYDSRGRLIERQVPGSDIVYMVYDPRDRVVLTQDANQRATTTKYWTFIKYDDLNRPILTGIKDTAVTRDVLQTEVDKFYSLGNITSRQFAEKFVGAAAPNNIHGYTNLSYPRCTSGTTADADHYLTVAYYDDYTFRNDWTGFNYSSDLLSLAVQGITYAQPATGSENNRVKSMMVGNKVKLMDGGVRGGSTWLKSIIYYDQYYQPIQIIADNHKGGKYKISTLYDFSGSPLRSKETLNVGPTSVEIFQRNVYDHLGRISEVWHNFSGQAEILVAAYKYNELGQLIDKKLHSTLAGGANAKQSIDYRYNIRGWLTRINDSKLTVEESDPKDYFGMDLAYNLDLQNGFASTKKNYGGNISAVAWSGQATNQIHGYDYTYDGLNRLKNASSKLSGTPGTWVAGNFDEKVTLYDLNGNIKGLQRYGKTGVIIDDLEYNYGSGASAGNRLLYVKDNVSDATNKVAGFFDGNAGTTQDYKYDDNGNLVIDLNKGIGSSITDPSNSITYNFLNLTETVTKGGNSTRFIYDALGTKLAQITTLNTVVNQTDYVGSAVLENNALQFVSHPEGRVVMAENKLVVLNNGETSSGITASEATLTPSIEQNGGEKYIRITAGSGAGTRKGASAIGGTLSVTAGERYKIRVKGYRTGASDAYLLLRGEINNILTDLSWPGARLPNTVSAESWIEQTITIPANTSTLETSLVWDTSTAGEIMYLNELEIIKLSAGTAPEYQYNIKDHLGNVRVTFTTRVETEESLATLETPNEAIEQSQFIYYDEAVKINSPLFDHTDQAGSNPGVFFYRGINLNGPATVIDGNPWVAGATAANFNWTGGGSFENQTIPLIPTTDANKTTMLRSSIYGDVDMTMTSVPNGTYDIYLSVWEDSSPQDYYINVEGVQRLSHYYSGGPGNWTRLGPFRTVITDGNINVFASGVCNISGLEVWTVTQAAGNQAPVVNAYFPDQTAQEGQAYSYTFPLHTFIDPDTGSTITYSANQSSGSALPAWLTFNASTRTFSGTPTVGSAGYLDIRVTASDGLGGTTSDVFMLAVTSPAATTFYRGVNFNGPAITIDANSWLSSASNPNFAFTNTNGSAFENQSVTLIPATDVNRATMIRSSMYGPNVNLMFNAIPNGIYDISIYVWEDNDAETYNVAIEGLNVITNYNSGSAGTWTKLGPYRRIINDGTINISNVGGIANFSGVEIRTVPTSTIPVTGISISPSPFNVLIGKSAQLSRTISPANASNKSVSWTSSNTTVALVNNDGWVTGVSAGTATITASINGFSSQATVNITNTPSSYSTRLTGTANEKYGLAKSLSVMPGDVITMEVFAKYIDTNTSNWNAALSNLISMIAAGTAPTGTYIDGGAAGSIGGGTFPYPTTLVRTGDAGTGPKAYLNYLVFDKYFVFKNGGFKRLSATPKETGTDVPHERLAFDGAEKITITEPGYVYIYLSNENPTPVEVYFDDFKVTQTKGPIVSSQDYYPFGLTFNSYQRENAITNQYLFQEKELLSDLNLSVYDFEWRQYDPAIGRTTSQDPHADSHWDKSPYSFLANNPGNVLDPTGMDDVYMNGGSTYLLEEVVITATRLSYDRAAPSASDVLGHPNSSQAAGNGSSGPSTHPGNARAVNQDAHENFAKFVKDNFGQELMKLNATQNIRWELFAADVDVQRSTAATRQRPDGTILIRIGARAMFDRTLLYLAVGHELIHAADLLNGNAARWRKAIGNDYDWYRVDGREGGEAVLYLIMEHRAYSWTVAKELELKVDYQGKRALEHINSEINDLSIQWLLNK